MKPKIILIIEDDPFLRTINVQHLKTAGYEIMIGNNGEEGLKSVAEKMPDLIILDLILPGMSGFEMMTKLKQDEKTKNIPFIIFSNLVDEKSKEEARKLDALAYIVKSDSLPDTLVNKINEFFKK